MTITQRSEDDREQSFGFDDPDIDMEEDGVTEKEYSFVFAGDLRQRTIALANELPAMTETEWMRLESVLPVTPLRVVQDIRDEFMSANRTFRGFLRRRADPQEIEASLAAYICACLESDGGNPSLTLVT